jgi:hypothetical protein
MTIESKMVEEPGGVSTLAMDFPQILKAVKNHHFGR